MLLIASYFKISIDYDYMQVDQSVIAYVVTVSRGSSHFRSVLRFLAAMNGPSLHAPQSFQFLLSVLRKETANGFSGSPHFFQLE